MRLTFLFFGVMLGFIAFSWAIAYERHQNATAYDGEFGTPLTPQSIYENGALAHFDVQVHNRGDNLAQWDSPMQAQHGSDCSPPPATHTVQALYHAVFVCADHLMTAVNGEGYAEVILTPSQIMNCSVGCTVQWDMSTEKMSARDWPDVWLTPWSDNVALPFEAGDVDLQGVPRQGIHVSAIAGQGGWRVSAISNYTETELGSNFYAPVGTGIDGSVNQSAVRQTFKLTVTPGHIRLERLASATAPQFVWLDTNCACLLAPDYVVQFGHHSYTPTKDGAGVPATWHWDNFNLSNTVPFTLIHTTPTLVTLPSAVTWSTPAPSQSYLRFSGLCRVLTDAAQQGVMAIAPRQTFIGHPEHASSYFIPIQAGRTSVNIAFAADSWYLGPCAAKDFHVWSKGGSTPSTPTPTPNVPTPTPSPTSTPTSVPTATQVTATSTSTPTGATPTSTPMPSGTTVTFDNLVGQDQPLNGQYPTGLINWGSNKWWLAAPWFPHTTKSISFNNGTGTSRTFAFVNPRVLVSLKAGGISPSTITLSCAGNTTKVQAIPANTLTLIATGWTVPCTTVTVSSSNGWDTNFDDLLVQ